MPSGSLTDRVAQGTTTVKDAQKVSLLLYLVRRPLGALFLVLLGGGIVGFVLGVLT